MGEYAMQEAYGGFAALYDPLMQDVDYDGWAGYLASFLPPSGMIVDCACGTGAITIRLARKGFSMIGVDISPEMLEQAASKARKAGLRIPFVCQDMARLQLHRPCQGIVCACDGVNYLANLADVEAFFSAAPRGLCPGGWLLFDVSLSLIHISPPAPAAPWTPPMCCWPWACPMRSPTVPCGSPWGTRPQRRISTTPSTYWKRPWRGCAP